LYSASKKKTARKQPLIQTTDKQPTPPRLFVYQLDQLEKRRYTMITSKDETRQDEQANTSKKKAGDFKMF
jgi:hypothetical protein